MFPSIRLRITIPYAVIILATTFALTLYLSDRVRQARTADLEARLLAEAWLMSDTVEPLLNDPQGPDTEALDAQARQWASILQERITIIGPDGTVLGESDANRAEMDNHLYRLEVQQALKTGQGVSVRFSRTLNHDLIYAAVAVKRGEEVAGFVRVAVSLEQIKANVNQLSRTIVGGGIVTALVSILLATYVASRTVRPIRQLTEVVDRMAEGDMGARLLPITRDEVAQLTRAFNHMADQLRDKVATLAQERGRLSAVLHNMADGVIITDDMGEVLMINAAAARILRADAEKALGCTFARVVYHHQLIDLWNQCRESGEEQTETVETGPRGTFLQATVTPMQEIGSRRFLVFLQDLTQVRRLETVRRDFISNISHELRTPLASLALVVETLRDGAIEDPPAARRFLVHMENELSALTQMVEELLELSRIESGKVPLDIRPTRLARLIRKPVKRLSPQAERMGVQVSVVLPPDLPPVMADAKRIHQVITNLVHNAIKFTPAGGQVTIFAKVAEPDVEAQGVGARADVQPNEVIIAVTDTGIGIPAEYLPRIFERFYKTDRARAQDGTGLGLAIAKHVVQGHGGRIWVESIEGVGSTFYFTLPIAPEPASPLGR